MKRGGLLEYRDPDAARSGPRCVSYLRATPDRKTDRDHIAEWNCLAGKSAARRSGAMDSNPRRGSNETNPALFAQRPGISRDAIFACKRGARKISRGLVGLAAR